MLILARRSGGSIVIGDDVSVTIPGIRGHQVRIGIAAPADLPYTEKKFITESGNAG